MSTRSKRRVPAATGAIVLLSSAISQAQVDCWAPGMGAPITLTGTTRSATVALGKPFRCDVFGIAGKIELGNQANNAVVSNNIFKEKLLGGLLGTGGTVSSAAYVYLQTGLTNVYPERLAVSGTGPGLSYGPVHIYGQNWTLSDPVAPKTVYYGFHLAGSSLLGGLLPGLVSPPHYNINPKGYFYVLGEYHAAPPVMTGTLGVSSEQVISGASVTLSYGINRYDTPIYRPPFLGLDLADIGLTVLGTPPQPETGLVSEALAPITTSVNLDLNVTINLGASHGQGWLKIARNSTP